MYDFKSEELLQLDEICCLDCFLEEVSDVVETLRVGEDVEIYGKSEFISLVLMSIISDYDVKLGGIDFIGSEYDKEQMYVLTITYDGEVWVEPAERDGVYLDSETTLALVYDDDADYDLVKSLTEKNEVRTLLFCYEEFDEDDYKW